MVQNYKHRILEWVDHHLALGIEKIIVFDNNSTDGMEKALQGFAPSVQVVDFPYQRLPGKHWNNVQRMALTLGVNMCSSAALWVGLLDADEFVGAPNGLLQTLRSYQQYPAASMGSVLVTNKGNRDTFNNHVLTQVPLFTDGKPKYNKVFLQEKPSFIATPHRYPE